TGYFDGTINFGGSTFQSVSGGDLFMARFSSDGTHLWSKSIGGADITTGRHIAIDANRNILLIGDFASTVNFGGTSVSRVGSRDMFLAKYTSAGNLTWVRTYGTNVPAPCLTSPYGMS